MQSKAAKRRKEGGTGRGPAPPPLKDWEEKLLQFIGTEVVSGIEGGLETSVTGPMEAGHRDCEQTVAYTTWCGCQKQSETREVQSKEESCKDKEGRRNWEGSCPTPSKRLGRKAFAIYRNGGGVWHRRRARDISNRFHGSGSQRLWAKCGIPSSVDDFRNKVKQNKEAAKRRKEGGGTGRCPAPPPLKDWEEKLSQLIGMEVVSGIEGGLETSVTGPMEAGHRDCEQNVAYHMVWMSETK